MKKVIITFIIAVALFASAYGIGYRAMQDNKPTGTSIPPTGYTAAVTSTGVLVTSSSIQVAATSTARNYLEIDTTGNTVYCTLNADKPAAIYTGIRIASSTKYVISADTDNLYRGAVRCTGENGITSTTTVTQF